jgi:hypothetical protein
MSSSVRATVVSQNNDRIVVHGSSASTKVDIDDYQLRVNVIEETSDVEVDDDNDTLVYSGPGIQGPRGPRGATGPAAHPTHVHHQNEAAAVWVIQHNFDDYPSVRVVDSTGSLVEGAVRYVDENTVEVTFASPFGGVAYAS